MRFENRILDEWLEEKVSSYFLCEKKAEDIVPVSSGKNFIDVVVKWGGDDKWFVRCFPAFTQAAGPLNIGGMVDMCRIAMIMKARPAVGFVSSDKVDVVMNDHGHKDSKTPPYKKAA